MIKAGLDIGNSKISCVVTDYKNSENIKVLSLVTIPTSNIKKNVILIYEKLFEQLKLLFFENNSIMFPPISNIVPSPSEYLQCLTTGNSNI